MIRGPALWLALLALGAPLCAQTARPPVVLLNGYQASCSGSSDSSATFGAMESLLAADGWQVAFFDNCSVRPAATGAVRPTIEELAQAFGDFLDRLGAPQVDVVAHSMGGLIVRAWLAGKQPQGGFSPPPVVRIRKAVFLATPHAGLLAISGIVGGNNTDSQTVEMFAGSEFLWDLATWNQRNDDLRGIDALSIAGNNGGSEGSPHSHDGVVVVTSASLAATLGASRVRVLPYCHADNLPNLLCQGRGVAAVTDRGHPTYRIVTSFLSGTADWQSIGSSASQDGVLSQYAGILLDSRDRLGNRLPNPSPATLLPPGAGAATLQPGDLPWNSQGVFFADYLPSGRYQVRAGGATYDLPVAAGGHQAVEVKPGPRINLVAPAAGNVSTLSRAPGMIVAIYGSGLENAAVTIGGIPSLVLFNSGAQINTMIPEQLTGLVPLTVESAGGRDTVNVLLEASVPALFAADGSGAGAALAFHTGDFSAISPSSPARPGETVSIFATGLGVPAQTPVLQADGGPATLIGMTPLAGSPGVMRLDFVTPALQAGVSSVHLQAVAGRFASNIVALYMAP